jgi:hypothetical protein
MAPERTLKIAIVGTGVAGSYLLNRIPPEHHVEAFEMREKDKWWAVCAWGTSAPFISDLVKMAGLDFQDYILHRGKRMIVDPGNGKTFDIKLNGLVCFDKTRLFNDMKKGKTVHYGAHIKDANDLKGFDMVIDATGFHRSLMPKLQKDASIPCFEVEVEGKFPWDDFYIKPYPSLSGYFWYFPLGEGRGHIGAGDFKSQYRGEIEAMVKKYGWRVVRRIGRPIRILPPVYCGPFYTESECTDCGKTIRATRIMGSATTTTSSGAGASGQMLEQSVSSSSTSSVELASFVGPQNYSDSTTRNAGQNYSDTRTTRTPDPSTRGQSSKQPNIPNGIRPAGHNGNDWCTCAEPHPNRPIVVGVGESIGTVYPLLGEGIIPSMQCVNLFVEHMNDLEAYSDAVLKHYDVYAKVYRFIDAKMGGNFSWLKQGPDLWSIYWHMKTNERRYGLETHLGDILKVVNV